ncbi:MAG: sigma-54-dependent Fis family transcriptional regulator [Planctomycetes bacterium]|nr:sigma-54-dependent Fis family transcriptional regulator [Planctomycetota bacterium]
MSETAGTTPRARILVADDEESMRHFVARGLKRLGYEVEAVASGQDAVGRWEAQRFDLCVSDVRMPGMDGMETLARLRGLDPDAQVVLMTAYGSIQNAVDAIRKGAFDYVTKPFEIDELAVVIERALQHKALRTENRELKKLVDSRDGYAGLVGQSPAMRGVFATIERLRGSEATVLVTGESGTGKEMVARALHATSARAGGPFVVLQCAAIPDTLLESELFGHEPGAFTGAVKKKRGLIEKAHGGTLFVDEIADLSLMAQSKLERVLETREVVPLGGSEAVHVDLRIVAASNKDLEAAVRAGTLRRELYFRLDVVRIHLAPLRERREDVPLLVDRFLETAAARLGIPRKRIGFDAMVVLSRQSWPGNVRELANVVERLCALRPDAEEIGALDLPDEMRGQVGSIPTSDPRGVGQLDWAAAVEGFERAYFAQLLKKTGGNMTEAAELAGMSRGHLHRKTKELGLTGEQFRA